jgi:hypothetical protein
MRIPHVDKQAVGTLGSLDTLEVVGRWLRSVLGVPMIVAILTACAPATHVLVGRARPPITPDQVTIYSHPPTTPFEEIARLDASSKSAFGTGGQKSVDKVIERLKIEAAKLGANGVILEGFSDAETGSIGTGVGSESYGNHSAVGVGVGGSLGIYTKTGRGDAIYVQPAGGG